jgi:hypothetical protein
MPEQLWTWIQNNANALAAVANILMVLIWLAYLELFFRQYRRARRPYIEIQHGQGSEVSSVCLLVNMGKELFDVKSVIVEVTGNGKRASHQVSDYRRVSQEDQNVPQILRQGPLKSGELIVIGRFEDLVRGPSHLPQGQAAERDTDVRFHTTESVEVRCVALHAASGRLIGASRRFCVQHRGKQPRIHPEGVYTRQLYAGRHRKQLKRWLSEAGGDDSYVEPQGSQRRCPSVTHS